jgi:uncharacterized membrane protein YdbT with pleckstrin-like domain
MLAERINLDSDEHIIALVRKHWFLLVLQLLGVGIAAILPFAIHVCIAYFMALQPLEIIVGPHIITYMYAAWFLVIWMALFGVWTNYYLDVWTITNKRLIAVDQRGLFHRNTGSFRLERLQDINVSVRGIIATFLNFGDLEVETASNDQQFVARGIPNPQELKAIILRAADTITFSKGALPIDGAGL